MYLPNPSGLNNFQADYSAFEFIFFLSFFSRPVDLTVWVLTGMLFIYKNLKARLTEARFVLDEPVVFITLEAYLFCQCTLSSIDRV